MDCIDSIKKYIDKNLSEKRRNHTYGVRDTALKLADKYGCDKEKAEKAALLHDIFRGVSPDVLNYHVRHLGLDSRYVNDANLAHGPVAAQVIQRDFGVKDQDIINAVRYHTTGRDGMSLLEKIIYIADAIEPGRTYPGVDDIRKLAATDIDAACLASINKTIDYVTSQGKYLDGETIEAKKFFEREIKQKERADDK